MASCRKIIYRLTVSRAGARGIGALMPIFARHSSRGGGMISITGTLTGGTTRSVSKRRMTAFGMFALGVGYFLWYTPYSALAKAISGGMLPGMDHSIGGLVLLPAHVLGQLLAMPVFVIASGWWRYSRRRRIAGRNVPFPAR